MARGGRENDASCDRSRARASVTGQTSGCAFLCHALLLTRLQLNSGVRRRPNHPHAGVELSVNTARKAVLRVSGPILLFAAIWLNWRTPLIRFDSALANELAFIVAMLVPTVALIVGPGGVPLRNPWLYRLPLIPFALVGLLSSLMVAMWLPDAVTSGKDPRFELMRRYSWGAAQLTLYRANCGMVFCDDDIMVLRAERPIVPGVMIVRDVCWNGPADSAEVQILAGHRAEIRFLTRGGKPSTSIPADSCPLPRFLGPS